MKHDLAYLGRLPRDRHVTAAAVAGNLGFGAGVLVKFRMTANRVERFLLLSGPSKAAHAGSMKAAQAGYIPKLTNDQHRVLLKRMPKINKSDWNMENNPSLQYGMCKMLVVREGIGYEFLDQNMTQHQYWLPTMVARWFGEYLDQFKETFIDHVDDETSLPRMN